MPWALLRIARTKSRELFLLVALTLSLGIALTAAGLFGVSLALGAFLAPVLYGDAGNSEILDHAGLDRARPLVVTIPDDPAAGLAVAARQAAPHLPIVARASTRSARKITPTAAWPLTSVSAPSFGRRAKKLSTPLDTQLWPGCIRGVHHPPDALANGPGRRP